jgi:hypothetical protein
MATRTTEGALGPPSVRSRSWARVWWAWFGSVGAVLLVWCFVSPVLSGPDEPSHVIKAYAVAHGDLTTSFHRVAQLHGSVPMTDVRVPTGYARLADQPNCYAIYPDTPASCAAPLGAAGPRTSGQTYMGAYPPLYYALVGWPSWFLSPGPAVYAMRVLTALLCAALLAAGLTSATRQLSGALVVGAALALTPTVLWLAGTVNPNSVEICAAFSLWLTGLELLSSDRVPSTGLLVEVGAASVLFVASRSLSPVLLVAVVALLGLAAARRARLDQLWADGRVRRTTVLVGVAFVMSLLYIVTSRSYDAFIVYPYADHPSRLTIVSRAWDETPWLSEQMIGAFGWLTVRLPTAVTGTWLLSVGAFGVAAAAVGRVRERAAVLAAMVATLALPLAAEFVDGPRYGFDWQGRYTLPIAIGVPILSGWALARSGRVRAQVNRALAAVVAVGAAAVLVLSMLRSMDRFVVGASHPLFDGVTGRGIWRGPLTPLTLVALGVVASVAYGAVVYRLAQPDRS